MRFRVPKHHRTLVFLQPIALMARWPATLELVEALTQAVLVKAFRGGPVARAGAGSVTSRIVRPAPGDIDRSASSWPARRRSGAPCPTSRPPASRIVLRPHAPAPGPAASDGARSTVGIVGFEARTAARGPSSSGNASTRDLGPVEKEFRPIEADYFFAGCQSPMVFPSVSWMIASRPTDCMSIVGVTIFPPSFSTFASTSSRFSTIT